MIGTISRRTSLQMIGAAGALLSFSRPARAFPLESDDGSPIRSFRIPEAQLPAGFAAAQRVSREVTELRVFELFDYNCGYCRGAGAALDAALSDGLGVELVLVHHPILSSASEEAAVEQQAVVLHYGAERAYELHLALLGLQGRVDGGRARDVCKEVGLDGAPESLRSRARDQVAAMRTGANALGIRFTPTFILADTAFVGWPGPVTMARMIAAKRRCGELTCA